MSRYAEAAVTSPVIATVTTTRTASALEKVGVDGAEHRGGDEPQRDLDREQTQRSAEDDADLVGGGGPILEQP